jgi:spermidine synthase
VASETPRDVKLAIGVPLLATVVLAAGYELGPRQTDAYLGPALSTPRLAALLLMAPALAIGFFGGRALSARSSQRTRVVLAAVTALSLLCSCSGGLWFCAFGFPRAMALIACGVPLAAGLFVGTGLGALHHSAALPYRELSALRVLLSPWALASAVALTLGGTVALSYLGLWRAAAALGGALATLATFLPRFFDYLGDLRPPRQRPGFFALGVAVASFAAAQAFVPARLLARYLPEVVWANEAADTVVISAQNTFELFEAQQLRATSADDYRLAELAVHPVLSRLRSRRRVLMLGPAGGFLEREALRYRNVAEIVSLSEHDRRAFSGTLWAQRTREARERYVVAEPIPWLEQHAEPFDAVVVSLPLPASPREGKYYTRYFFELLASRLSSGGALVVQGVPRDAMPETFATLRASLLGAGLSVSSYEAPLPLLGAVSFFVAAREAADTTLQPGRLPAGLRYLDDAALRRIAVRSAEAPLANGSVSTLSHQRAVALWHSEQEKLGN